MQCTWPLDDVVHQSHTNHITSDLTWPLPHESIVWGKGADALPFLIPAKYCLLGPRTSMDESPSQSGHPSRLCSQHNESICETRYRFMRACHKQGDQLMHDWNQWCHDSHAFLHISASPILHQSMISTLTRVLVLNYRHTGTIYSTHSGTATWAWYYATQARCYATQAWYYRHTGII